MPAAAGVLCGCMFLLCCMDIMCVRVERAVLTGLVGVVVWLQLLLQWHGEFVVAWLRWREILCCGGVVGACAAARLASLSGIHGWCVRWWRG